VATEPQDQYSRRECEGVLTIESSSPPIVALSPAPSSTVSVPSSSSSSTLPRVVFLPLKLLLPFSVLPQYPLLFCNFLRIALYFHGRFGQIGWPAWMRFLAVLALGTETGEIKFAQRLPNVLLRAIRSERAESLFVVWTWG
jgi:hypothetical protein